MPELRLSDEMVERALSAYTGSESTGDEIALDDMRRALHAAFDGVPLTNYGVGLALQFFDLVICVKDNTGERATAIGAGVYRLGAEPNTFDDLGHKLDVSWGSVVHPGQEPVRYLKRVAVSQLDAPVAGVDGAGEGEGGRMLYTCATPGCEAAGQGFTDEPLHCSLCLCDLTGVYDATGELRTDDERREAQRA